MYLVIDAEQFKLEKPKSIHVIYPNYETQNSCNRPILISEKV